ncbi:family 20 glycosylhydrolase [Streptomyces sp. NPDC059373]
MVHLWSKFASVAGVVSVIAAVFAPEPVTAAAAAVPAIPSIPAVRSFTPSAGGTWHPGPDTRVVAPAGSAVEDEARLLASELRVPYANGPARQGDVSLSLEWVNGNPESYEMTSSAAGITVRGTTDAGVFYGTRTLLQVLRAKGGFPAGVIQDRPDRPQRGLMVDVGRKYFTRGWLEARIREMGDLKLNELQLHLSDNQGFRIQSTTHPEVVSARHLSKADIRAIVALAAQRHITVIPEIDSPGHLGAVLAAHPSLRLRNASGTVVKGALDISRAGSATLVDDLLKEYAPLFPGPYWHLGGDEYGALTVADPQRSFPRLAAYARARFGPQGTVADAATAWLNDRAALLRGYGKTTEAWNDGFFTSGRSWPDAGRQVDYWSSNKQRGPLPETYLREGRQLVNLNSWYLYYVLGGPANFPYPTGRAIYERWTPALVYRNRTVPAALAGADRILGGRLAIWCDDAAAQTQGQITDGIRMPLRALAQKTWDPRRPTLTWTDFKNLAARVG